MLSWRSPGDPQAGGAEVFTTEVLRRMVDRGHEVVWLGARYPGSEATETVDGIRIVRMGRQWSVHVRAWRWLRHRRGEFDVVVDQINTLPFCTPLYLPAAQRRLLIFQTAREYWWRQTRGLFRLVAPFGYAAEPWYLRLYRATRAMTISDSTRDELVGLGLPAAEVAVLPVATTGRFTAEPRSSAGSLRCIVIGRLTPAKFVEEGIETFATLGHRDPDARLDIVGSGEPEYRALLERLVTRLGLQEQVTFHGRVDPDRKDELLEAADVHIFTSHREGWGLTVTEAAALGAISVGYDAPGVRDAIADVRLLAPLRGGTEALGVRLRALDEDRALLAELRDAAWHRARTMNYDTTTDRFEEQLRA